MNNIPRNVEKFVVIYDIAADDTNSWGSESSRRRAKVSRILLEYGIRTQKSVFELEAPSDKIKKIAGLLAKHINLKKDRIYIYPIEGKVVKKIHRIGRDLKLLKHVFI